MLHVLQVLGVCLLAAAARCEPLPNASQVLEFGANGTLPLGHLSSDHLLEAFTLVSEAKGRAQNVEDGATAASERLLELLPTVEGRSVEGTQLEVLQASLRAELTARLAAAGAKVRCCFAGGSEGSCFAIAVISTTVPELDVFNLPKYHV